MKLFDMLLDRQPKESNGHNPQFGLEIPPEIVQGDRLAGLAGGRITRSKALEVPAVLRARNMIAGTLATLPVHIRDRDKNIQEPVRLLRQIDPDVANVVTYANTYEDLLFEGIGWWRITAFDARGFPANAEHVSPQRVLVTGAGGGLPATSPLRGQIEGPGRVHIDGVPIPNDQIIRFDSPNPPLLVHAARAIRTALLLDKTAAMYTESPLPLGAITPKEGVADPEETEVQQIMDKWEQARRTNAWAYLSAALDAKVLQFNAEQIQLADQRQHAVLEIARAAGVSPEDLGVSVTSRTYANREQDRQDTLVFTLAAYISAVEQRLSMRDVLPRGFEAKVNVDAVLRTDLKTRLQAYETGVPLGVYTEDEARDLEDRPPLTAAQRRRLPVNETREVNVRQEIEVND